MGSYTKDFEEARIYNLNNDKRIIRNSDALILIGKSRYFYIQLIINDYLCSLKISHYWLLAK